jgi:hypothetical protein
MKNGLRQARKEGGDVYIEMSNSAAEFSRTVGAAAGESFREQPKESGRVILQVLSNRYLEAAQRYGLKLDLQESSHLVLLYDDNLKFRLYQLPIILPDANQIHWVFRDPPKDQTSSRCLVGYQDEHKLLEWYMDSGGHVKYYPLASKAAWVSPEFTMEPLPADQTRGISSRAKAYYPRLWAATE